MEHPKTIGDRSTLAIMMALTDSGREVFFPFGENTRVDLVISDGHKLARVQCKTGRLRFGAVVFKVCSSYAHHSNSAAVTRAYLGEVDYFAVYCPETTGVYLIPIDDLPLQRQGALRVDAPRNSQRRKIRFASDYEISRVTATPTTELAASVGV
jgi:hypothetical protein